MPIYDYRCLCGNRFTAYHSIREYLAPTECPRCGETAEKVILHAPRVFGDYEGYVSPASGKWIEGRKARERDFAETGTRPYELGEMQDGIRRRQDAEQRMDDEMDDAIDRVIGEWRSN